MSKAYRKWKEMRRWGLLHRGPKPKRIFTMRNYRRWKRVKARWNDENTKIARDCASQIMPNEWAEWAGNTWDKKVTNEN